MASTANDASTRSAGNFVVGWIRSTHLLDLIHDSGGEKVQRGRVGVEGTRSFASCEGANKGL